MRKKKPNIHALKLLYSFCPAYIPLLIAKIFFEQLSPYFNLYLSAEIVNEIAGSREENRLVLLVLIAVIGNFAIAVISGVLNRFLNHKETLLSQREAAYYNRKTLSLDYCDLENTEVRQLRRKIVESAKIDHHGKKLLMVSVERLIGTTISVVLALILGSEMFILMFTRRFSWYLILFVGLLIVTVGFNVWYGFQAIGKMAKLSNDVSQAMIDENRIDDAIDCYNMGKDVRLYRQDKLIMKIEN